MRGKKLMDEVDISTMREMEARGMTRKEMAAALETTVQTLRKYLGTGRRGARKREPTEHVPSMPAVAVQPSMPAPPVQISRGPTVSLPDSGGPVMTLRERLEWEARQGIRKPPNRQLRVKQKGLVLEGEVGTYSIDLLGRTVTVETVLHGAPATLEDVDKLIRELQDVKREMEVAV